MSSLILPFLTLLLFLPHTFVFCEAGEHQSRISRPERETSGYHFGDSIRFVLTDPKSSNTTTEEERHPWIRLFEGGKDSADRDLKSTLDFLKLARSLGKKKIRPDEDNAPGLIVTFRGFELNPNPDNKTYTLKLYGEFNATEVQLSEDEIQSLLAGRVTQWELSSQTSRSTGSTRYQVKTDLKMKLSLEKRILKIHSLEGTGTITTIGFLSTETYVSPAVKLESSNPLGTLFEGKAGELPPLPTIK